MNLFRRLLGDSGATAAAEMALVLPGIAYIMLNVADMGIYLYTKMQVDLAAHEAVGAARGLCNKSAELPAKQNCGSTLYSTMLAAAQSTTLGTNVTIGGSVNAVDDKWYCSDSSAVLQEVANYDAAPPTDCSGTLSGSTAKPGEYVSVTASYSFSPIFPGASIAAMLPANITRKAWMRLQ